MQIFETLINVLFFFSDAYIFKVKSIKFQNRANYNFINKNQKIEKKNGEIKQQREKKRWIQKTCTKK